MISENDPDELKIDCCHKRRVELARNESKIIYGYF